LFAKGNGKDVLWSTYTLRFNNSENHFKIQGVAEELFRADRVNELQRDLREMMRLVEL